MMKDLFESRKFDVQVHSDLTHKAIEKLLLKTQMIDHSQYDAFVCCIMTHGKQGVVFSSDGQEIRILNIVKYFNDRYCSSLQGKPKLFFIQACMTGKAILDAACISSLRTMLGFIICK